MMTDQGRKFAQLRVIEARFTDSNVIGVDCDGLLIRNGDTVEVKVPDALRERVGGYEFCGTGKRGTASESPCFPVGWTISVYFGDKSKSAGCVDYHTKVVN